MQVEVKQTGAHEYEVRVRVPRVEYEKAYEEALKALSKRVRLPGFRPGHAPTAVLRKQFGEQLHEDAVEAVVRKHYAQALSEANLVPAVQPAIAADEAPGEEGFSFVMRVAVWPEVELDDLSTMEIPCTQVEVTDGDVDELVARLLQEVKRFVPEPERAAELGDRVRVDLSAEAGGEPLEDWRGEEVPIVLGEGRFIPEVEQGLVGAKAGEEKQFSLKLEDGRQADLFLLVREVARPGAVRNIEELAEALGHESVEALRADLRARLEREAEALNRDLQRQAALDALLQAKQVSLPDALVQAEMRALWQRIVRDVQAKGGAIDEQALKDPSFIGMLRARAERDLRLAVLIDALKRKLQVEVSDEELRARAEEMAQSLADQEREKAVNWLMNDERQRNALREEIAQDKALAALLANGKLLTRRISLAEWQKEQAGASQNEQGEA